MRTKDLQKENLPKTNIKSKAMFAYKFDDEIIKTIEWLAEYLDKNLENEYDLDYVEVWVRSIKIKVNDENKYIFRTVQCTFDYNKVDEKYGNSRVELTFTELSARPRFAMVGKFNIVDDRESIYTKTLRAVIKWIEEIYE